MKTKQRRSSVPHLVWRKNVGYWSRRHAMLPNGRIVKSLEVKKDRADLAIVYATALNTLCERGDWNVVRRWNDGDVHITEIARAVREGEYSKLNKLNIAGTMLGDACEAFTRRAKATLARHSWITYESALKQLRDAWGDDTPMASVTTAQAEAFLHEPKAYIKNEPWAPKTQASARTCYKALWNFVIDREAEEALKQNAEPSVTRNPWAKTRTPKRRKTRHSFLTPEQWKHLINHPKVKKTPQDAFLCAAILGLRRAEIQNLRTKIDVKLDDEPRLKIQDRDGLFKWRTKTENSLRDVPIPKALLPRFLFHAEKYAGEKYFFRPEGADKPPGDETVAQWVRRCFKAAGLKHGRKGDALTLHSLRHTCATWLLSAGVPLTTVAKRLGDTNKTILETYAHAIPSDEAKADSALEDALR